MRLLAFERRVRRITNFSNEEAESGMILRLIREYQVEWVIYEEYYVDDIGYKTF